MKKLMIKSLLAALSAGAAEGLTLQGADATLQAKVDELAKSPELQLGPIISCYLMLSDRPDSSPAEYICPICGEKTVWNSCDKSTDSSISDHLKNNLYLSFLKINLIHYRKQIKEIQKHYINITLDERQFCHRCSPKKQITNPSVYLMVAHKDNINHRNKIEKDDLKILCAFFEGQKYIILGPNRTKSVKSLLPRISQLLGVTMPKIEIEDDKSN